MTQEAPTLTEQEHSKRGLKRGILTFGSVQVLMKALAFLAMPLYTQFVEPTNFGRFNLAISVGQIITAVAGLGVSASFARLYFKYQEEGRLEPFLRTSFRGGGLVFLLTLTLIFAIAPLLQPVVAPHFALSFFPLVALGIAATAIRSWLEIPTHLFQIEGRYRAFSALQLGMALATPIFTLSFLAFLPGDMALTLGILLPGALAIVVLGTRFPSYFVGPSDRSLQKEVLSFALSLVPYKVMGVIVGTADRFVLERYSDLSTVGIYALAYTLAATMDAVAQTVYSAWQPVFYANIGTTAQHRFLARRTLQLLIGLSAVAFLGIALAPIAVRLLFAPSYVDAGRVAPCIILGLYFHAHFTVFHIQILHAQRPKVVAALATGMGVLGVGASLLFAPRFGVWGVAWSMVGAYAFEGVVAIWVAQRLSPLPLKSWTLSIPALALLGFVVVTSQDLLTGIATQFAAASLTACAIAVPLLLATRPAVAT